MKNQTIKLLLFSTAVLLALQSQSAFAQEVTVIWSSIKYRIDYSYTGEQCFLVNNEKNYTIPSTTETVEFGKAGVLAW